MRNCPYCKEIIKGRSDKKFCTPYCKSSYHYQESLKTANSFFKLVDKQLKLNRKVLKSYNKTGKSTIRKSTMLQDGFNPKYFTHYWKSTQGDVYLFCYEFGFLEKMDNGKPKYVLVTWQDYMN
ncbi:MAG: hypothetical protein KAG26_08805 [Methylococcales bacterium]|nr:hypothetical protein [Methylococcales bacterium]